MKHAHYLVAIWVCLIAWSVPRAAQPGDPAATQPATERAPFCIGWDDGWVACRYSSSRAAWETWKSPRTDPPKLPGDRLVSAVGDAGAAVLDPRAGFAGWFFDEKASRWIAIPDSGLKTVPAGELPAAMFMGGNLLIWGMAGDRAPFGAVLDTAQMRWRPLPEAPVSPRFRCLAAVIGDKFLVWGGYPNLLQDGAVYDLAADRWERLPESPIPFSYGMACAVWRDKFVVVGGRSNAGGAIYDPAARTWEKTAPSPLSLGELPACAIAGDLLFLWSGLPGKEDRRRSGATYDFVTQEWKGVSEAPMPGRALSVARPSANIVTVGGGWVEDSESRRWPEFVRTSCAFDLRTREWRALPDIPVEVPYALHPSW